MARYDYRCVDGHVTDTFRPMDCTSIDCPQCGAVAGRIISPGVGFSNPEADTRGMFRRFQDASQTIDYAASKREAQGETVHTPSFWREAKRRAQSIERAGEAKETLEKLSSR